jgi:hypothetical protein
MKKIIIIITIFLSINSSILVAQTKLIIEGTTVKNSEPGTWTGVAIQRSVPTTLTYRNNSITSVNASGYMLQAGDEIITGTNNNLDGEIISGNNLVWNGSDVTSITHGIFTGHNKNAVIKYNYLDKVPMAIIRKSANGMTNTSGGVAYNIVKNPVATGGVVKGMNNVSYYNNTFYSNISSNWRGLLDIYTNTDITPAVPSTGAKIKNNIFYTVSQIYNISIRDAACLTNFESDYNVFYCESGTPVFNYLGSRKTFVQWQELGYDKHSVVINPGFNNTVDFIPSSRLDFGTDLGTEWQVGLSTSATWTPGVAPATAVQNGKWQVGARVYNTSPVSQVIPNYVSAVVENSYPSVVEITYSSGLANIIPPSSAFDVKVNSVTRNINSVAIIGQKVRLTLASEFAYGDIIKVSYVKPANNPLQTVSGGQAVSISEQLATNKIIAANPIPAKIKMTIYPNPAYRIVNLLLENSEQENELSDIFLKIFDLSGRLFLQKSVKAGIANFRFPINLKPGIYVVILLSGNLEIASQLMIVN